LTNKKYNCYFLATFHKGNLVLPTLLFILWAYGMYALISALAGRKGSKFRARGPGRRYGWLALGSGLLLGLGLTVVLARSFVEPDHNLGLAGFLGTVWAEGWPDKVNQRVEYPPIKGTATGNQPVYALLHPETSPADLAQEKTAAKPRPIKKPKVRNLQVPQAKSPKSTIQVAKKDKGAAKGKSKTTAKKKKL
jgi:hypothetical protein